jgi:outer membrane protein TolC
MITNTFELLADTRARVEAVLLAVTAKRDYWLAAANLDATIHGGATGDVIQAKMNTSPGGDNAAGH